LLPRQLVQLELRLQLELELLLRQLLEPSQLEQQVLSLSKGSSTVSNR
jgi:hypothetical protein